MGSSNGYKRPLGYEFVMRSASDTYKRLTRLCVCAIRKNLKNPKKIKNTKKGEIPPKTKTFLMRGNLSQPRKCCKQSS